MATASGGCPRCAPSHPPRLALCASIVVRIIALHVNGGLARRLTEAFILRSISSRVVEGHHCHVENRASRLVAHCTGADGGL